MHVLSIVFAGLAGALHVVIFLFESVLFMQPRVHRRFLLSDEEAGTVRLWAYNQGFYNLFLALGCLGGLMTLHIHPEAGATLVLFTCACMTAAALVLVASEPKLLRAALVQGVFPALAIVLHSL